MQWWRWSMRAIWASQSGLAFLCFSHIDDKEALGGDNEMGPRGTQLGVLRLSHLVPCVVVPKVYSLDSGLQ
jgi:hypothetical protein